MFYWSIVQKNNTITLITVKRHIHMEKCSFCGKTEKEVQRFLRGQSGLICESCVRLCHRILMKDERVPEKKKAERVIPIKELPKPKDIKEKLDAFIATVDADNIIEVVRSGATGISRGEKGLHL